MEFRFFARYVFATGSYGLLSAIPQVVYAKQPYRNAATGEYKSLPPPVAERIYNVLAKACIAPALWPAFLLRDATRLEHYCRGMVPRKYGIDPEYSI